MVKNEQKSKWGTIIIFLIVLFFLSIITAAFLAIFTTDSEWSSYGNVAVIPIKGFITVEASDSYFNEYASATKIIRMIKEVDEDESIKAIVFEINSPGGGAVASSEIADAIKKSNKTSVAWIREVGASGGYWIASSCDQVVAHRMSITGSIGVLASYLEFSGFIQDHNITYERLVGGKYKDMGSPFKELSDEERRILQSQIDEIHDMFIEEVAANRNLDKERVEEFATGEIMIGKKAKEFGLVDILGSEDEVKTLIEDQLNITVEFKRVKETASLLDLLSGVSAKNSFILGQGIGSMITGFGRDRPILKT